ncbi:MAG: hypothetical protein AAGE18_07720 [Pseudomonadota bacterium]
MEIGRRILASTQMVHDLPTAFAPYCDGQGELCRETFELLSLEERRALLSQVRALGREAGSDAGARSGASG